MNAWKAVSLVQSSASGSPMHALVLAGLMALAAGNPVKGELLLPGLFHGDEVQARSGESWLCLMSDREREELKPCTIEVKQVHDPIMQDDTGKEVSLRGGGNALALFRDIPLLKPGPVRTYFLGRASLMPETFLEVGGDHPLRFGLQKEHKGSYSLILWEGDGSVSQTLREGAFNGDGAPELLWAGDLDRDGKLDLLLDISNHSNVSEVALFLSSLASTGELVGKAGAHRSVGC